MSQYALPPGHVLFVNEDAVNDDPDEVSAVVIDGWFDAPEVRDVRENAPGRDGELTYTRFLGGRTLEITGIVTGSDYADLQANKADLAAVFNQLLTQDGIVKLPVPDATSPPTSHADELAEFERVTAAAVEGIVFGERVGVWSQAWQVVLRAADPRIYSDQTTSVDSGTSGTSARTSAITNNGSYSTAPILTVTGPTAASFVVSEPDSGLLLPVDGLTLGATETCVIDTAQRTVQATSTYLGARSLTGKLKALWPLNETSGSTADNAEGTAAYDGTYTGGFTLDQTGPRTGLKSVELNGTTGYVDVAVNAGFLPDPLLPDGVAFECWFRIDTFSSGTQTIVDCINSNRGWRLDMTLSSTLPRLRISWGTGSTTTSSSIGTTFMRQRWYHLVLRIDQTGKAWLTLDGRAWANKTLTGVLHPTSGSLRLGATIAGTNFFDGNLAAAAVYAGALTSAEAAQLYSLDSATSTFNAYRYLDAQQTEWANLLPGASTLTLASAGLDNGSKLNTSIRDARL